MSRWTTYNYDLISKVPNKSGVYVIFYGEEAVYVGQSENLRKRLRYHEYLGPSVREGSIVKVRLCPKLGEWRMIEFRLLRRLRPRLNRKHVVGAGKDKYTYDQDLIDLIKTLLKKKHSRARVANRLNQEGQVDSNRRPWTEVSVGIVGGVL